MLKVTNHQGNSNYQENTMGYNLTPVKIAIIKNSKTTSIGKYSEKLQPLNTVGRNIKWCSGCGTQERGPSKKS
jgi:hypothetical protein